VKPEPAKPAAAKPETPPQPEPEVKKPAAPKKKAAPAATTIIAKVDVGFGNNLYLRGEGAGELSWEQGVLMENMGGAEWSWSTSSAQGEVKFKLLINDAQWSTGDDFVAKPGETCHLEPGF